MGSWNLQKHLDSNLFWPGDGRFCWDFPPFAFLRRGCGLASFQVCMHLRTAFLDSGVHVENYKKSATLNPKKLQSLHHDGTLKYYGYTIQVMAEPLSFFLGWQIPNLVTGLHGGWPRQPSSPQNLLSRARASLASLDSEVDSSTKLGRNSIVRFLAPIKRNRCLCSSPVRLVFLIFFNIYVLNLPFDSLTVLMKFSQFRR